MTEKELIRRLAPAGEPLELLFERATGAPFALPRAVVASYGGELCLPKSCVFANFVASLEGIAALPGATESGQVISGRNPADRFVMGVLRACADAVLLGAGTFRKSAGHLWQADRIYPPGAAAFAQARQQLKLEPTPRFVLLSASGNVDVTQPALEHAWLFTTPRGEAALRNRLPSATRLIVQNSSYLDVGRVLKVLRDEGLNRILTEGGPSLFSELVKKRLVDDLFLTSSPALFGRFENDERKALTDSLDLQGTELDLTSVRRHGSHLFLRYALRA